MSNDIGAVRTTFSSLLQEDAKRNREVVEAQIPEWEETGKTICPGRKDD